MDLTTRTAYRVFDPSKSTTTSTEYWERVDASISSVSAKVIKLLGRQVEVASVTEIFSVPSGAGLVRVHLRGFPLSSVTSVTLEDYELPTTEYRLDQPSGRLSFIPPIQRKDVEYPSDALKIIYTGGMATNTDDFMSKYPDIVAEVHAQIRFELARITTIAEVSQTNDGQKTELAPYDLIPSLKRIISKYAYKKGVY